ncbi:hypothetical protein BaRGS_00019656 [Batillaria attramentaria]|uniref:Secreted protein n=1 Tax=Batillaria attramentaria TaxID=370345 RepID=A0ABD0KPR6_9CAEN
MAHWHIFSLVGFLLLWCGARALNCEDTNEVTQEEFKCFSTYGISVTTGTTKIENVVQSDPTAACRYYYGNLAAYKKALTCAFGVGKDCLRQLGTRTDLLPDADRLGRGMDYLCSHVADLDADCITTSQSALNNCAFRKGTELAREGLTDTTSLLCASYRVAYECMKEELRCPKQTLEVQLNFTNQYMRPRACSPFDGEAYSCIATQLN